jgi:hypothetical protein
MKTAIADEKSWILYEFMEDEDSDSSGLSWQYYARAGWFSSTTWAINSATISSS